ncbi:hypothetical protein Enr13x_09670 [Stieleria neptunia]|uniref:Uncharacterized protein n=2 Tax=Stieleria neptunia TaxID=2527979 RepID=A0A518HJY0_9BACT|nr:hypothetical protein Enr13x_09670 [Stieleria neptunia]
MKHRSFHSLLTAVFCLLATGLARQAIAEERITPALNTESTAQAGEEILHQGDLYQRAAIFLSEEITFGKDGAYALTPGYYFRGGDSIGWETYSPADGPDAGRVKKAPGAITLQGSFHYSNDGKTIGVITNFYQAINTKAKGITRTTRPAISPDALQRSLVYGGKTGTKIKLAYREIWKNITRPSQDTFVEYDLADSKVVEIQGARIEVIEATNNGIRYRVTRAFDSKKK